MNKQEWLDCKNLNQLLDQVTSNRKKQLFTLACCRSVEHLLLDQRSKDCLVKIELFIDGKISKKEFESARQVADAVYWEAVDDVRATNNATWAVVKAFDAAYLYCACWVANAAVHAGYSTYSEERAKQLEFLRDIYNPFPLNIKFSSLAISLAEQIYDGDNDARLILSDYLEENKYPEELYLHLKQPTHLKGCWVIDQILEKS